MKPYENLEKFLDCRQKTSDFVNLIGETLKKENDIDKALEEIENCEKTIPLAKDNLEGLELKNKISKAIDISQKRLELNKKVFESFKAKLNSKTETMDENLTNLLKGLAFVEQHESGQWAEIQIRKESKKLYRFDSITFFNWASILFLSLLLYSYFKKKDNKNKEVDQK